MKITVVGLGKIGLPLAVQYARKGHTVVGADINTATVELVNAAREPFPGEHLLQQYLADAVSAGLLTATTDTSAAVGCSDAVVVAVPLFVDDEAAPDFRAMDTAALAVGKALRAGTLVSFETTLPVGTTRNRLTPILESESGLVAGRDFFVVFSPERVFTGRVFADLRRYPKLVGGINPDSAERAVQFYESVLDFDERTDLERSNGVWNLGSSEAAELVKLAETTYRDVNIGLANQFARFADRVGIDIYKVIEACNSQPFSHIHQPGIAVGGHCIPVYPRLYLWGDPSATVVRAAREANVAMPEYALEQLRGALGDLGDRTVLVLGAAYRAGVKETAYSGVFALVDLLRAAGAMPVVHDPLYSDEELRSLDLEPFRLGSAADAVILHTDHDVYRYLGLGEVKGTRVVLDGRGCLSSDLWGDVKFVRLGSGLHPQRDALGLPGQPNESM